MSDTIKMYSTPWCGDCRRAKMIFKSEGVAYEEIDISDDAEAIAYVEKINNGLPQRADDCLPRRNDSGGAIVSRSGEQTACIARVVVLAYNGTGSARSVWGRPGWVTGVWTGY